MHMHQMHLLIFQAREYVQIAQFSSVDEFGKVQKSVQNGSLARSSAFLYNSSINSIIFIQVHFRVLLERIILFSVFDGYCSLGINNQSSTLKQKSHDCIEYTDEIFMDAPLVNWTIGQTQDKSQEKLDLLKNGKSFSNPNDANSISSRNAGSRK